MKLLFAFVFVACVVVFINALPNALPKSSCDILKGQYIVKFDKSAMVSMRITDFEAYEERVLSEALPNTTIEKIELNDMRMYFVETEQDLRSLLGPDVEVYPNRVASSTIFQKTAPWGLDRISHRNRIHQDHGYELSASGGTNIDVYVIDSVVDINHPEFEGRAKFGISTLAPSLSKMNTFSGSVHGTHVAGIIASKTYGVAKNATIISVQSFNSLNTGSSLTVTSGIVWATNEAKKSGRVSIINLSFMLCGEDKPMNHAIAEAIKSGVYVVASAGNQGTDSCDYSPGRLSEVVTVGAISDEDKIAKFSNFGSCVNIFAPGVDILSTIPGKRIGVMTGTSMSAPHVTGALALLLSQRKFNSVKEGVDYLLRISTVNRIRELDAKSPNKIVYDDNIPGPESNPPSVPPDTGICSYLTCWFFSECEICKGLFYKAWY